MRNSFIRTRSFYINKKGELYLQFYLDRTPELNSLSVGCKNFSERLQSGYQAQGEISRITPSGVTLKNWRII
jgi:hypothetical protein